MVLQCVPVRCSALQSHLQQRAARGIKNSAATSQKRVLGGNQSAARHVVLVFALLHIVDGSGKEALEALAKGVACLCM